MNIQIEVCERMNDRTFDSKPKYHACIKDKPGVWSCGASRTEAIGDLIQSHPEIFNLEIVHLKKMRR